MTSSWRQRRIRRKELIRQLHQDLMPIRPPNPLVLLWRWRSELGAIFGLSAGLTLLIIRLGWLAVLVVIAVVAATAAWREARHWVLEHIRCIITAHRIRTGCAQAWIQMRSGKLPIILLTRPEPYGERVYVWCRAGICL